eukprot:6055096-Amphidinium_carterae.1
MAADDYSELPSPQTVPCPGSVKSLHVVLLPDTDGGCKCVRLITYHNGVSISKLRGMEGTIYQYKAPGDARATQSLALH